MIVIGLTGSVGMGKSTVARMFAELGAAVHDADAVVHALYARGGEAAALIAGLAPQAVADGAVDRGALRAAALADGALLKKIEAAIHPLVAARRDAFLARARKGGARMAVLDIPLLFETGTETLVDTVVVVSTDLQTQRGRVLLRPEMTEARLEAVLARQMPDAEKRRRADFIIDTSCDLPAVRAQVARIIATLTESDADA